MKLLFKITLWAMLATTVLVLGLSLTNLISSPGSKTISPLATDVDHVTWPFFNHEPEELLYFDSARRSFAAVKLNAPSKSAVRLIRSPYQAQPLSIDWSPRGNAAYIEENEASQSFLFIFATGDRVKLPVGSRNIAWSPDGQYIAYQIPTANSTRIYSLEINTGRQNFIAELDNDEASFDPVVNLLWLPKEGTPRYSRPITDISLPTWKRLDTKKIKHDEAAAEFEEMKIISASPNGRHFLVETLPDDIYRQKTRYGILDPVSGQLKITAIPADLFFCDWSDDTVWWCVSRQADASITGKFDTVRGIFSVQNRVHNAILLPEIRTAMFLNSQDALYFVSPQKQQLYKLPGVGNN